MVKIPAAGSIEQTEYVELHIRKHCSILCPSGSHGSGSFSSLQEASSMNTPAGSAAADAHSFELVSQT